MSNAPKTLLRWLNPPNFFAIFRLLGSIGNHQRVGFWRNMKKSQNHCTLLYRQYLLLHLEFAAPVWSPWLAKDKGALEKFKKRAVNMV
jgi:hypothetical protein